MFKIKKRKEIINDPLEVLLLEISDRIIADKKINEITIEIIKTTIKYSTANKKNFIDRMDFLIERLEFINNMTIKDQNKDNASLELGSMLLKKIKEERETFYRDYLLFDKESEQLLGDLNHLADELKRFDN